MICAATTHAIVPVPKTSAADVSSGKEGRREFSLVLRQKHMWQGENGQAAPRLLIPRKPFVPEVQLPYIVPGIMLIPMELF